MSRMEEYNYWGDSRTRAAHKDKKFDIEGGRLMLTPDYTNYFLESGEDLYKDPEIVDTLRKAGCLLEIGEDSDAPPPRLSVPVRAHFEVCGMCRGHGKVVNPSIDCGGISEEDFDRDPDFREEYFAGRYDISCPECKGLRVVPAWEPIADNVWSARVSEWLQKWEEDEAYSYAEMAAERRMGA